MTTQKTEKHQYVYYIKYVHKDGTFISGIDKTMNSEEEAIKFANALFNEAEPGGDWSEKLGDSLDDRVSCSCSVFKIKGDSEDALNIFQDENVSTEILAKHKDVDKVSYDSSSKEEIILISVGFCPVEFCRVHINDSAKHYEPVITWTEGKEGFLVLPMEKLKEGNLTFIREEIAKNALHHLRQFAFVINPKLIREFESAGITELGELTPKIIVDISKVNSSILNDLICWNDEKLYNRLLDTINLWDQNYVTEDEMRKFCFDNDVSAEFWKLLAR